jgi:hypothetical protein
VVGRKPEERRSHLGHRRADPTFGHPYLGNIDVEKPLTEESSGTTMHGVGGEVMTVGCPSGDTTEEGSHPDLATVEFNGAHVDRTRVPTGSDDVDASEQLRHSHAAGTRIEATCAPRALTIIYALSLAAPAGTVTDPVPPMAPLDVDVVAAALVGMP